MSETAAERKGDSKNESTFIFQYGRCYNALMPHTECTQGHQEGEKEKADVKKRGNEKGEKNGTLQQ